MAGIFTFIAAGAFVALLSIARALNGIEDKLVDLNWELKKLRNPTRYGD